MFLLIYTAVFIIAGQNDASWATFDTWIFGVILFFIGKRRGDQPENQSAQTQDQPNVITPEQTVMTLDGEEVRVSYIRLGYDLAVIDTINDDPLTHPRIAVRSRDSETYTSLTAEQAWRTLIDNMI